MAVRKKLPTTESKERFYTMQKEETTVNIGDIVHVSVYVRECTFISTHLKT